MVTFPANMSVKEIDEAIELLHEMRDRREKEVRAELKAKMEAEARRAGFDLKDIIGIKRAKTGRHNPLPAKWRNPKNPDQTYSGRGRPPVGFSKDKWERVGA